MPETTVPDYLEIVVTGAKTPAQVVASENVLALDSAMKEIYGKSLEKYKEHFKARVPIIYALFNEIGGEYHLWRPGQPDLVAPPPPPEYALAKSVSHSALGIYSCVAPYLMSPGDGSWRGPVESYMARIKAAKATVKDVPVSEELKKNFEMIYAAEIAYMEGILKSGEVNLEGVQKFANEVEPTIAKNILAASKAQVTHWEKVLKEWKELLGPKMWEKAYAVTNTLYVTRRNNIHFTILANIMGKEAINTRLLLIEGTGFEAPIDQLFDVLTRIVADRAVGQVFFGAALVMDSELIWEGAQRAIAEAACPQYPAMLPGHSPMLTHEWPWITAPGEGPAGLTDLGKL